MSREQVDKWRRLPQAQWRVIPGSARLLDHWRNFKLVDVRPFLCQVEAVETLVWLSEVAPHSQIVRDIFHDVERSQCRGQPRVGKIALKLATAASNFLGRP